MKTNLMGWTPLDLIKNVAKIGLNPVSTIPTAAATTAIEAVQSPAIKKVIETAAQPALKVLPVVAQGMVSVPKILTTQLNPSPIKFSVQKSITPPPDSTVITENVAVDDETEEKTAVQELISLLPLGGLALFAFAL